MIFVRWVQERAGPALGMLAAEHQSVSPPFTLDLISQRDSPDQHRGSSVGVEAPLGLIHRVPQQIGFNLSWQGATTLRAHARKEEQHRQRTPAQCDRVRSALTHWVNIAVAWNASVHAAFHVGTSGQLPSLG
jgi:hypothetical protein